MVTLLSEVDEAQVDQVRVSVEGMAGVKRVAVYGFNGVQTDPQSEDDYVDDDPDTVDNPEFVAELREALREGFAEVEAHQEGRVKLTSLKEFLS